MEFSVIQKIFEDKQIVNPANPEQVFSCSDLVKDWKVCRREWRLQTKQRHKLRSCWEYRSVAHKCYWKDEEEFTEYLMEQQEEKKRFYDYLVLNGSVIADEYKDASDVFARIAKEKESEQQ